MGNATVYWDSGRQSIDLGAIQSLEGGLRSDRKMLPRTGETIVERIYNGVRIKRMKHDAAMLRALLAFQSWAQAGHPFGFARDSAKRYDSFIEDTAIFAAAEDPVYLNRLADGGLEVWNAAGTIPDGATVVEADAAILRRENRREHVREGMFSAWWDSPGPTTAPNARLQLAPTASLIGASSAVRVSYQAKVTPTASCKLSFKNSVSGKFLQAGGTWGAPEILHDPDFGPYGGGLTLGNAYGTATHAFTSDAVSGELVVSFFPAVSASASLWIDDVRVWVNDATARTRSTTGVANGDYLRLISRTRGEEESAQVSTFRTDADGLGPAIVFTTLPKLQFERRDIVRSEGWFPHLKLDQDDALVTELPTAFGAFEFDMKAIEVEDGRH